jgi:very-short-patch-repair endonuclease
MGHLIFILLPLAALMLVAALLKQRITGPPKDVCYQPRPELFSPAERSFLGVLEQAVAGQFRIMGKVRLGDLIQPAKDLSPKERTTAWNRIHQKHVDFVLCLPNTLAPFGVVELDDASHQRKDRSERDAFVDKALKSAGIPMVRFSARKGYAVAEVQAQLEAALSSKAEEHATEAVPMSGAPGDQSFDAVNDAGEMREGKKTPLYIEAEVVSASNELLCMACNSPMVKRMAKKGPNAGKWFWACSAFPKCRQVVAIK